jgi:hypothetical protein
VFRMLPVREVSIGHEDDCYAQACRNTRAKLPTALVQRHRSAAAYSLGSFPPSSRCALLGDSRTRWCTTPSTHMLLGIVGLKNLPNLVAITPHVSCICPALRPCVSAKLYPSRVCELDRRVARGASKRGMVAGTGFVLFARRKAMGGMAHEDVVLAAWCCGVLDVVVRSRRSRLAHRSVPILPHRHLEQRAAVIRRLLHVPSSVSASQRVRGMPGVVAACTAHVPYPTAVVQQMHDS